MSTDKPLDVDMGSVSYWAPLPELRYRPLLVPEEGGYGSVKKPALVVVSVNGNDQMSVWVSNKSGSKGAWVDFAAPMPDWLSIITEDAVRRYELT